MKFYPIFRGVIAFMLAPIFFVFDVIKAYSQPAWHNDFMTFGLVVQKTNDAYERTRSSFHERLSSHSAFKTDHISTPDIPCLQV